MNRCCTRASNLTLQKKNFETDADEYWSWIQDPSSDQLLQAKTWKNWATGDFEFALHPAYNVEAGGEPDTKHGLTGDLYTHVYPGELRNCQKRTRKVGLLMVV